MIPALGMQHRTFDQTRLIDHQGNGAGLINYRISGCFIEFPPGRATLIEQGLPSGLCDNFLQPRSAYTEFFKIAKIVNQVMRGKPRAGFFDRVAIRDAVEFH